MYSLQLLDYMKDLGSVKDEFPPKIRRDTTGLPVPVQK